jgi:hypothetical protein
MIGSNPATVQNARVDFEQGGKMNRFDLDQAVWQTDGFVHIERFLQPAALTELQRWAAQIESWVPGAGPWLQHDELTPRGPRRARSENFTPFHDAMRRLASAGPLLEMASILLGEPAILFKEKLNYKHPGGAGYAPHQDLIAYPGLSRCVTCLVAVDDASELNGCLEFAPGYHRDRLPQGGDGCIEPVTAAKLPWRPVPTTAGSIIWFHGLIPHRSGDNQGRESRRGLYLTYNALSEGNLRERYYRDKASTFAAAPNPPQNARVSLISHFRGRPVPIEE